MFRKRIGARAGAAALVAWLGLAAPVFAQKPDASILRLRSTSTSPLADRVVDAIVAELKNIYTIVDAPYDRPAIIHSKLPKSPNDLVFIIGDRQMISELAKIDLNAGALANLKVDFINPRAAAVPLYVFGLESTVVRPAVRVAYGVTDTTKGFNKDEASFVFKSTLGAQAQVLEPTTNARDLVRMLVADPGDPNRVDFVAIYDEEPSLLLNDFLAAYRPYKSRLALRLFFFPAQYKSLNSQLNFQGPTGSTSSFAHYDNLLFHPEFRDLVRPENAEGLLTVLSPALPLNAMSATPVMLSNLRFVTGGADSSRAVAKVAQIVSYAHLDALLSDQSTDRCTGKSVPAFESYLLNALLSDPASLVKSLSLWSNLKLSEPSKRPSDTAGIVERDQLIENMVAERLEALKLNARMTATNKSDRVRIDFAKVAGQLASSTLPPLREQFSSDDATAFDRATAGLRTASGDPRSLRAARSTLVQLLLKQQSPACILPGPGLFVARGYDPFFYLSVIDSLLAMQSTN